MAKCDNCQSCLRKYTYFENQRYLVCTLCYKVYYAYPSWKKLVEDKELADKVVKAANIKGIE